MSRIDYFKETQEYKTISEFYGTTRTKRSDVPLMNHIDEGIEIMVLRNASDLAIRAYIVHPIFQGDDALTEVFKNGTTIDPNVVLRAMEYRRAANAYLCTPITDEWDEAAIGRAVGLLLEDVRDMLIADKLQNQKDFLCYHLGTHKRSDELVRYFNNWLKFLGV